MIKSLCIALFSLLFADLKSNKEIFVCTNTRVKLFSEAPLENIEATSLKGFSVYNIKNGEIQFNIPINSFKFKRSLIQEHFNENYMESDVYPFAKFKGKINQGIDPDKNGEYWVSATGELEIHGIKKPRTITGSIKVTDGRITIDSQFSVKCEDHDIKIPKIVFQKIAENIQLTVSANYNPTTSK